MAEREQNRARGVFPATERPASQSERLPYAVELRESASGEVERVVARASNATVARAIFKAALGEYPGRRITLRRGEQVIADSDAR